MADLNVGVGCAESVVNETVTQSVSCEGAMEECLEAEIMVRAGVSVHGYAVDRDSGESGEEVSKVGVINMELESSCDGKSVSGSEQVQEEGIGNLVQDARQIAGFTDEPTRLCSDDVNRRDQSLCSSGVLDFEGARALHDGSPQTDAKDGVDVLERVPEVKENTTLEKMNGIFEGSDSVVAHLKDETLNQQVQYIGSGEVEDVKEENLLPNIKKGGKNLETLGDLPVGGEVAAVSHKTFHETQCQIEDQEVERETAPQETKNIDKNNVMEPCSGFSKEDESMEFVDEVAREDGRLLAADSEPSRDCGADSEEATTMEVEEALDYEDEVVEAVDNSVREDQGPDVNRINESRYAEEAQVVAFGEEFSVSEGDGDATVESGKEHLTFQIETEVNDKKLMHKDEEHLNTIKNAQLSAEKVGLDVDSESSVNDTQEFLQVPVNNASHKSMSTSEKGEELKVETLGETLVEDPSVDVNYSSVDGQSTDLSKVSESFSPSVLPVVNEIQNLEAHKVSHDQAADTHMSDIENSDEAVMTEGIIESYEAVAHNHQGMVLNKCIHGSLLVDLDICMEKDKDSVKEDARFEEVEPHMMTDAEFSEYFDGSANTNSDLYFDTELRKNYTAREREREMIEHISVIEQANDVDVKVLEETTPRRKAQVDLANHLLPEEPEDEFSVSDLVWGKVKSHPWWPGQIFDPEDASEKAMKYHKKDSFFVAYFGDRTFAWNEASVLKPFWRNFSHIEKQSSSEVFQNAIISALEEVSRRILLGLACSCLKSDIYSKFECQIVENAGIRQESSRRYGLDVSTGPNFLKPKKLVEYIRALAGSPSPGTARLGLVIAKAQVLAFKQMRRLHSLPESQFCGRLLESDDADNSGFDQANECLTNDNNNKKLGLENRINKRKHNLKDGSYSSKKERMLSDLIGDGGSAEQEKRISIYAAKVSSTVTPIPKPSFKVGDCIRRAASQLTGSPSILRNGNEKHQKADGIADMQTLNNSQTFQEENLSLDEILMQLQTLARAPVKGHRHQNDITSFFSDFRDSINLCQYVGRHSSAAGRPVGRRKRKMSHAFIGAPEEFEFDDVNDSYWTDMIIQNHSEEQPGGILNSGRYQLVTLDPEKSHKSSRRGYSRKQFSTVDHHEMAGGERMSHIDRRRQLNLPTELILSFSEADSVPSEMHLIKTFRRFGPLKETETEIDLETSCARVVFKRCSDAEVAFSSAGKFSIFGPVFVNYQLNYSPSVSFNNFPFTTSEGLEDGA